MGLLNLVTMTLEMYTPPPTTTVRHSAVLAISLVLLAPRDAELSFFSGILVLTDEMIVKAPEFFSRDLDTSRTLPRSASNYQVVQAAGT